MYYHTFYDYIHCRIVPTKIGGWSASTSTTRITTVSIPFGIFGPPTPSMHESHLCSEIESVARSGGGSNAKVMNEQSRPAVAMMAKCIVELLGTDLVAAYQHAFVYIRQLAIHLRNAIKNKSKDAYAAVFNWQYMNCLMVWAAVISTYPGENQLQPLMYPLVQIIIGTVNLVPAARYFPMRFHCIGQIF